MTARGQTIMIWWGLIFMFIYGFSLWLLFDMVPPPSATLNPNDVASFYGENNLRIKLGAVITSYVSAFMVPISVVIAVQLARLEKGTPVWAILAFAGGILMSIFLVLPPLFWGVAAYNATRSPEITALMHELGMLTLTTTDQFYIFQMVAIVYISLTQKTDANSPFPRWMGYFTAWAALMFEAGAIAFVPKTGPFSWNGLFVFWSPFVIFGVWVTTISFTMLKALKRQQAQAT